MSQQQHRPTAPTNQFGAPQPQAVGPTVTPWAPPPPTGTDGVSVAGLVLAILCWPVGLVLSCVGLSRTKGGRPGRGVAVAGLVVSLVQVALVPVLAAVAIPVFLNQRDKAELAVVEVELGEAATAMELAAVDAGGVYPTALPADVVPSSGVSVALIGVGEGTYCLVATDDVHLLYMDETGVASPTPCG